MGIGDSAIPNPLSNRQSAIQSPIRNPIDHPKSPIDSAIGSLQSAIGNRMKITFLGTGTSQGVPVIACACETCQSTDPRDSRLRPSVYIETADAAVLVDAGPDLRMQALRAGVKRVDAVLFTHGHADHILGIDDLRRFNHLQGVAMPCYADAHTIRDIRTVFQYAFDPATPKGGGLPRLELFEIAGAFCIGRSEIQ